MKQRGKNNMIIMNKIIHRRYVVALKYIFIATSLITALIIVIQKGKNKMKKIKLKEISRQFVINVFDDNLSLSYFKQSNQTVEDFFKMYNVEIRELDENETIYTV